MQRLKTINSHFTSTQTLLSQKDTKHPDDIVICSALRTCLSKAKRGPLRDTTQDVMLSEVLKAIIKETKVDPALVSDLIVGNVLQPEAGALQARAAQLMAGFPETTSATAINRLCSSGIEACAQIAAFIKSGVIDIGIGAGTESMSQYVLADGRYPKLVDEAFTIADVKSAYIPDGMTSENVVQKFGMTRKELDEYSVNSHLKAAHARKTGLFKSEIVPIKAKVIGKNGQKEIVLAHEDDGIRANSSMEALSKLKPAFMKNGWTTGGSSSQLTDGAAAVMLARRSVAEKHGLPILAKFITYATAGVAPEIMGVGPAYAIPKCLGKAGLKVEDIDIFEINEAFASQAKYCVDKLGIDHKKVNPKGGSIALGHPLAATGARMVATLIPELKRTGKRYGIVSMCVGTGMGACALIENEN